MDNPSDEEVTAAARAICHTFYQTTWEGMSEFRRDLCMNMARAALIAAAQVRAKTHVSDSDADNLRAAIAYALDCQLGDGLDFLRAWNEGDQEAMTELAEHRAMLSASGGNRD